MICSHSLGRYKNTQVAVKYHDYAEENVPRNYIVSEEMINKVIYCEYGLFRFSFIGVEFCHGSEDFVHVTTP